MNVDVLIRGGLVVDSVADVAVRGGSVVGIGDLSGVEAAMTIDATGRVVLPGFIDAHVHAEGLLLEGAMLDGALTQGVTTLILGQDGTSLAPAETEEALRTLDMYWSALNGASPGTIVAPFGVDDLLVALDGGCVNVAYLVPNGNVRLAAKGWRSDAPDRDALGHMRRLVRMGVEEGAVGLSSGLDYTPSRFADADELAALCAELAPFGLPYVTHMRGYRDHAADGIAEAADIARRAEVPLHVSHFSGRIDQVLPHLDRVEAEVVDVSFDAYPFVASSTILAMAALPEVLRAGSPAETIEQLASTAGQAALRTHLASPDSRDVSQMILAAVAAPRFRHLEGLRLADAAEREGLPLPELIVELLVAAGFGVAIIDQRLGAFSEEDIRAVAADARHMVGSDGTYVGTHPHVRAYASFAKYVDFTARHGTDWRAVVEHTSGRAARRFGLSGRGAVEVGAAADLVVLDPASMAYSEDVRRPPVLARGVEHVFVNGVHAVADGRVTGTRGGRSLRGRGAS